MPDLWANSGILFIERTGALISNSRILSVDEQHVTFSARGRKSGEPRRTVTLTNVEFIRRYLIHVLPSVFQKIRYYGFLNNRYKTRNLKLIFSIRKDFWNGFKHPKALVTDDKAYTFQTAFFEPYKEFLPTLTVFFHSFRSTNDFTATILINTNGNQGDKVF